MTSNIREFGPKLVENGYPVVELVPGKKCPTRKKWQENPLSAQACRQHNPAEGVGVLCGFGKNPICAVDVDFCGTQEESDELFERMCRVYEGCENAPYRVGRAPKFALIFRAEASWTKQVTRFYTKDGDPSTKSRLEVLGKGQQLALYHVHPDTQQSYTYPYAPLGGATPIDTPVEELPLMTYKGVQDLCEAFDNFMLEHGWKPDLTSQQRVAITADEDDFTRLMPKNRVGLSMDEIRQLMAKRTDSWGDYSQWLLDGMRIHHETEGSPEGLVLWDELSQQPPGYDGFDTLKAKWKSFSEKGQDSATMWPIAKEAKHMLALAGELSERGLACRVLRDWGERIKYAPMSKTWLCFSEKSNQWARLGSDGATGSISSQYIRPTLDHALEAEIEQAQRDGNEELAKAIQKFQFRCNSTIASVEDRVLRYLSKTEEIYVDEKDFDSLEGYIAVRNGLVNVATKELVSNRPDALMIKYCDVDYDPSADCPKWRHCVEDWFETPEVACYMQKVLGKMLLGKPDEEAFYLLVGYGANGKSSFLNSISSVLGGYSSSVNERTLVGRGVASPGGPRSDIAKLRGARFVYCSETDSGEAFRAADLKNISGGDKLVARRAYAAEEQEFKAQFTLFIATNFPPNMQGADDAMRRRIRLIHFPKNFESPQYASKRVKGLSYLLEKERAGIFNWMLEGYELAKREGFDVPQVVVDASNAYVDSHDLVTLWFDENCEAGEPKDGEKAPNTKELFQSYLTWLESMNESTSGERQRAFTEKLKKVLNRKGIQFTMRIVQNRSRVHGIRFIDKLEEDKPEDDFD